MIRSMGAVGSSADNAAAESLNAAAFKGETRCGASSWPTSQPRMAPLPDVAGHRADGADRFARRPGGLPTIG